MVIIMNPDATAENIKDVIEMIQGAGDYYNYTKDLEEGEGKALGLDKLKEMGYN